VERKLDKTECPQKMQAWELPNQWPHRSRLCYHCLTNFAGKKIKGELQMKNKQRKPILIYLELVCCQRRGQCLCPRTCRFQLHRKMIGKRCSLFLSLCRMREKKSTRAPGKDVRGGPQPAGKMKIPGCLWWTFCDLPTFGQQCLSQYTKLSWFYLKVWGWGVGQQSRG
jgi:hypothetical protein